MKRILVFCILLLALTVPATVFVSQSSTPASSPVAEKTVSADGRGSQPEQSASNQIKIALIDTGVSLKAIEPETVLAGYNYVTNSSDTNDKIGHGTAVASVLVGSKAAGISGVSPNARLVSLVVKTRDETGKVQGVKPAILAQAIYDAVDKYQVNVINLSIGVTEDFEVLRAAVAHAEQKNVTVISSVGNNKKEAEKRYYPAAYETVIGVGSHNKENAVSDFSQENNSVMLLAPGEDFWMASRNGKRYGAKGTSYATAFVSGTVALLLEQNLELPPQKIRTILCETARDLYAKGYDTQSGFGSLDRARALQALKG